MQEDDLLFKEAKSGLPVLPNEHPRNSRDHKLKESHSVDILEGLIKSRKHLDL